MIASSLRGNQHISVYIISGIAKALNIPLGEYGRKTES